MVRTALAFAAAAAGLASFAAAPAGAQAQDKVLIIYGNDKCPVSSGQDIVICARKPESERYRIPEELRDSTTRAGGQNWADRAKSLEFVGRSGIGSCSTSGAGGVTGCYNEMVRKAREENKENGKEPAVQF